MDGPTNPRSGIDNLNISQRVRQEAEVIHSLARVLSAFQQVDRDTVELDAVALGMVHEIIVGRVLAIYEILDEGVFDSNRAEGN